MLWIQLATDLFDLSRHMRGSSINFGLIWGNK